jgi:thiol-disulfide isomerase/thioredoxin
MVDGEGPRDSEKDDGWWPEENQPPSSQTPDKPPRPPHGLSSRNKPRPSGRYSLFVGLAFVAIIVVALLNLVNDNESGILGVNPDEDRGLPLAEFAVPDLVAGLDKDANIAQDDCESSRNPCPQDQRRTPACEIPTAGAIRVCDLFDKPLAISFWFTRGGDCIPSQDSFNEVASEFEGRVNFLSINIRDDPATVADIARENRWTLPVGLDRDGAVSNLYRVGICPTIVLAYPGGILDQAHVLDGNYSAGDISAMVDDLIAASRKRAEAVR